jgi:large subunit ribosomal protein L4
MELKMVNDQGAAGTFNAPDALFGRDFNQALVHQIVVAFQANARIGSRAQKDRGAVNHSTKKPWRQKGTGRARAGSHQSPLWVGGGVVFGPKPRDFAKKVTKSTRQLALRKALTERLNAGDVIVVDDLKLEAPKTKEFIAVLKALEIKNTALLVTDSGDENLRRASRNVSDIEVTTSDFVNTYQVLRSDKLVFTRGAFEKLEDRLGKK